MINIKRFNLRIIKIDKKCQKNIGIYNTDDYGNNDSVKPLYIIISKADRYIKENKYAVLSK